jgi:hypothetical protein
MNIKQHKSKRTAAPLAQQRGAVLIIFVASLIAVLVIGGLALDGSHQMLNKARLQNSVDASALAAAKVLDEINDTAAARDEAEAIFAANADGAGNRELGSVFNDGGINLTIQFSNTVNPFTPGSLPAEYVRVTATGFDMPAWLISVIGIDELHVTASAVSGPSPTILNACNLVPLIICGERDQPNFGYNDNQVVVLKSGSQGDGPDDIGKGNFQLARMDGSSGKNDVRNNLAGAYDGDCVMEDDQVPTEPGVSAGPVRDGVNTRLNIFKGTMKGTEDIYPPDVVNEQPNPPLEFDPDTGTITQPDNGTNPITDSSQLAFNYDRYSYLVDHGLHDVVSHDDGGFGVSGRREMPVIVAECTGDANGANTVTALGPACFFLLQEMPATQVGKESFIFGEFAEECVASGQAGPDPTTVPGPYIIQLYKDSSSNDS